MAGLEDELGITHRNIEVNGISMHVAEKGEGPAVLFLHGFPELWFSWRHQIVGLADRGYRGIAPDLRGYGDTTAPPDITSYTIFHVVGDVIALLDALGLPQVFLVGHDWGASVAWNICTFRPDRVKALVNLGVPYSSKRPSIDLPEYFRSLYGDDYYICKFQEVGVIEAEFANIGTKEVMVKFFSLRDPGPLYMNKNGLLSPDKAELPSWLSQKDIDYYTSKFAKSGFTGPVNYYRCLHLNWELTAPWSGAQIKVPVKYLVGDLDMTYHFHEIRDHIHKGGFKIDCPLLEEVVVMKEVGHFINQEKPQEITDHIYHFIQKF